MKKKLNHKNIRLLLLLVFFILIIIIEIIFINNDSKKLSLIEWDDKLDENLNYTLFNQCELEWEKLNENVYFRKNLAFYYSDIKKIQIYLERKKDIQYDYKVIIKIKFENYMIKHAENKVNSYNLKSDEEYVFEYIEIYFNLEDFIKYKYDITLTAKIEVINNPFLSTNKPINLITKNFNHYNNYKKHSVLCGKTYYPARQKRASRTT